MPSGIFTSVTLRNLRGAKAGGFDAIDELYGTRQAFDGMLMLLACTNSEKIEIETLTQFLKTFSLRLHMCEKVLQKAAGETFADAA